ncbi:hypothetical protein ACVIW0_002074 [Bradyrhizobium sp. USDA 4454]
MTTIDIIRTRDGTYAVTLNDDAVAVGLTKAAAWRAAEQMVMSDTAEDALLSPPPASPAPARPVSELMDYTAGGVGPAPGV